MPKPTDELRQLSWQSWSRRIETRSHRVTRPPRHGDAECMILSRSSIPFIHHIHLPWSFTMATSPVSAGWISRPPDPYFLLTSKAIIHLLCRQLATPVSIYSFTRHLMHDPVKEEGGRNILPVWRMPTEICPRSFGFKMSTHSASSSSVYQDNKNLSPLPQQIWNWPKRPKEVDSKAGLSQGKTGWKRSEQEERSWKHKESGGGKPCSPQSLDARFELVERSAMTT
jgi:hypothetical protein